MRTTFTKACVALQLIFLVSVTQAQTNPSWEPVKDPVELQTLFKGKTYGGLDWIWHFRGDGKLGAIENEAILIREWSITENGEICLAVFSMPDKIIRCETVDKANTSPPRFRMVSNIGVYEIVIKDTPKELLDAIEERAGPE